MAFEYFGAHEQIRADMAFGGRRTVFRGFRVIYLSVNNLLLFALPKYRNSYALRRHPAPPPWRGVAGAAAGPRSTVLSWALGRAPAGRGGGLCLLERPCRSKRAGQTKTQRPISASCRRGALPRFLRKRVQRLYTVCMWIGMRCPIADVVGGRHGEHAPSHAAHATLLYLHRCS